MIVCVFVFNNIVGTCISQEDDSTVNSISTKITIPTTQPFEEHDFNTEVGMVWNFR